MSVGTLIIKGWYGEKNFGDDLLLAALINMLRGSIDYRILLWCRKRNYLRNIASGATFLKPWSRLQQPIALLWGGGTQFFTYIGSDREWNTLSNFLSILYQPRRLARAPFTVTKLLMRGLGKERLKGIVWRGGIGIGVGPFVDENKQIDEKLGVLRSMDWLFVRDKESLNVCNHYGINKAFLGADLAFLHPEIGKKCTRIGKITVIPRVSPMDREWVVWEDSLHKALEILPTKNVEIVSLCERDHGVASALATRLKVNVSYWDPDVVTLDSMIRQLVSAQFVVSARYHGALVSAAAGVPTLVLGLEQKLEALSRQLDSITICRSPLELQEKIQRMILGRHVPNMNTVHPSIGELRNRAVQSIQGLLLELRKLGR